MLNQLARNALTALASDLRNRSKAQPGLKPFAEALDSVYCGRARFERPTPLDHATLAYLAPALAAMEGVAEVRAAVRAVAPAVNWYQIYQGAGVDPALAEGMLAAQIAGMSGIVESDATRAGLFLLAPGIHYPLHTHGANEVYYCLSGSLTLQHGLGGAPFELTPGRLSNTPPHRLHSLTTGQKPVLMLYAWIGEVDSPNWWWEQDGHGGWTRARWSRNPDGSWAKTGAEPVTEAHRAEAGT